MGPWTHKFLAKIVIIPAFFGFVSICCNPGGAQAATDVRITSSNHVQAVGHAHERAIKDAHHCNHKEEVQSRAAIQAPTKKVNVDFVFISPLLSAPFFDKKPTTLSDFSIQNPLLGPPWEGKSIKGFLGVYRS